jgi:hypothetical protein
MAKKTKRTKQIKQTKTVETQAPQQTTQSVVSPEPVGQAVLPMPKPAFRRANRDPKKNVPRPTLAPQMKSTIDPATGTIVMVDTAEATSQAGVKEVERKKAQPETVSGLPAVVMNVEADQSSDIPAVVVKPNVRFENGTLVVEEPKD